MRRLIYLDPCAGAIKLTTTLIIIMVVVLHNNRRL